MLNWIINIIFLLLILRYGVKKIKTGIIIYCVGIFIAPVMRVGGLDLSFDVWCFPVITAIYIIARRNEPLRINERTAPLLPYFFVYLTISLISAIIYECGVSVATLYAIIRFIVTIGVIIDLWRGETVIFADKVLGVVLFVNMIFSIIQMTNIVSVKAFYDLYYKTTMVPLKTQLELGSFNRAYGATGSPVILGGIAALAYAFYFSLFVCGRYEIKKHLPKIIACVVCGVFALSKTAILAIPIITIYTLFMCMLTGEILSNKRLLHIISTLFGGGIVLIIVVLWMQQKDFAISWYLKFLTDPFAALETRYNSSSGILAGTMKVIGEHWLFGVGNASFEGVFIGDSTYVVLLYQTGALGLITYLFPYCVVLFSSIMKKDIVKSSVVVVFFLIALGSALLSCWFIVFAAILFGTNQKDFDRQAQMLKMSESK